MHLFLFFFYFFFDIFLPGISPLSSLPPFFQRAILPIVQFINVFHYCALGRGGEGKGSSFQGEGVGEKPIILERAFPGRARVLLYPPLFLLPEIFFFKKKIA